MQKVYQQIATAIETLARAEKQNQENWIEIWADKLKKIMEDAPSGSGFDSGTELSDDSTPNKLVFDVAYHHMNDAGYYDGWSHHKVIVKPSLAYGFDMRVTGRDRNGIKDYIGEVFHNWLSLHTSD